MFLIPDIPALVYQIVKFGLVGCVGLVIDFSVTWFFKERLHVNKFLANAVGFTVAVINNYFLNRVWSFHSNDPAIGRQFTSFAVISIIGLGINSLILYVLHEQRKTHFYLSKALATVVVFVWNFTANFLFTFHHG